MLRGLCFAILFTSTAFAAETKVLAISGSLREDSSNTKLLKDAADIARKMGATVTVIDLKDYPMPNYDGDLEASKGQPENAKRLREQMIQSQALIIASPEYNGSISGVLKNAIDWTSRTQDGKPSKAAYEGKKIALLSASPGPGGGARGIAHLKDIISNVGGVVISKQMSLPNSYSAFDASGHLTSPAAKQELEAVIQELLNQ